MPNGAWLLVLLACAGPVAAGEPLPSERDLADTTPRVYQEEFQLSTDGHFRMPGWMEGEPDVTTLQVEAGCRALGFHCDDDQDVLDQSLRYVKRPILSGTYHGTARILRIRDTHYYAKFLAPDGFTICKAGMYLKGGAISAGSTFGGAIERSGNDGLGVYADLGPDRGRPRWIAFRLLIQYVPSGSTASRHCWPDQTIVFLCRGPETCQANRAYPETYLR